MNGSTIPVQAITPNAKYMYNHSRPIIPPPPLPETAPCTITHDIKMELGGGERGDDLAGGVLELHHIHESEVVVGEGGHDVLLETADGRQVGLLL